MALVNLSTRLEHERGIVVESTVNAGSTQHREGNVQTYSSHREFAMKAHESGKKIDMRCRVVDEYWEEHNGQYICHVLYTVADHNHPQTGSYDDRISLTSSYGARGLIRSIIPGWGQIYKGSVAKGTSILCGEAACAVGIIVCENQRASYHKKMKEQPRHAQTYNSKADNWETGRNICIGAAAALYVYNLIDAAASKGARRVVVKNARQTLSFHPTFSPSGGGVSMTWNF